MKKETKQALLIVAAALLMCFASCAPKYGCKQTNAFTGYHYSHSKTK